MLTESGREFVPSSDRAEREVRAMFQGLKDSPELSRSAQSSAAGLFGWGDAFHMDIEQFGQI